MSGITITETTMTSPATSHTATATGGGWQVSWLPGRTFTQDQAATAMVIANLVGSKGVPRADLDAPRRLGRRTRPDRAYCGGARVGAVSRVRDQSTPRAVDRAITRSIPVARAASQAGQPSAGPTFIWVLPAWQ